MKMKTMKTNDPERKIFMSPKTRLDCIYNRSIKNDFQVVLEDLCDMKKITETDIENLIKNSKFTNPVHKDKLRKKLFESAIELDLDDLAMAAGGVSIQEPDKCNVFAAERQEKI